MGIMTIFGEDRRFSTGFDGLRRFGWTPLMRNCAYWFTREAYLMDYIADDDDDDDDDDDGNGGDDDDGCSSL